MSHSQIYETLVFDDVMPDDEQEVICKRCRGTGLDPKYVEDDVDCVACEGMGSILI